MVLHRGSGRNWARRSGSLQPRRDHHAHSRTPRNPNTQRISGNSFARPALTAVKEGQDRLDRPRPDRATKTNAWPRHPPRRDDRFRASRGPSTRRGRVEGSGAGSRTGCCSWTRNGIGSGRTGRDGREAHGICATATGFPRRYAPWHAAGGNAAWFPGRNAAGDAAWVSAVRTVFAKVCRKQGEVKGRSRSRQGPASRTQ